AARAREAAARLAAAAGASAPEQEVGAVKKALVEAAVERVRAAQERAQER
ncbi:MAG TPA: electron transport complex subunit RsxB, partial [Rhodocyclaceae bacterium]|nr:electron transport complex subunit RsxB [Rhodocyclaceae bacterium]